MILDRVAADAGDLGDFSNRHAASFAAQFENLHRQLGQIADQNAFALDLLFQPVFLLLESGQEIEHPRLPVRFVAADFSLRAAHSKVVSLLDEKTRPYRYGEFDVLAVSMQPSTGKWDRYMFTLGRWLLPGKNAGEMATIQPVAMAPNQFRTDDFATAAAWFRADDGNKRMALVEVTKGRRRPLKNRA